MKDRKVDFLAKLKFITTQEGGRKSPAKSGYRPQLKFGFSENQTSGEQTYIGRELVHPGETVYAEIRMLSPLFFSYALLKGMGFEFREGARVIGTGEIIAIINEELNKKLIIKNKLEKVFPIIFEITDEIPIDWEQVYDTFNNKFEYYKSIWERKNNLPFRIQASFYNIITEAVKGDASAIRLLDCIRFLFGALNKSLDKTEKKLLKNSVFGFLTNMDSKYLNFLGELLFVNYIRITKPGSKLVATEEPTDSGDKEGPKIDFRFINYSNEKHLRVEILNLHLNEEKEWNEEEIERLLAQKITEKLNSKRIVNRADIILVPILWGKWDHVQKIARYYEERGIEFGNTFTPFSYIPFADQSGNSEHIFGTIDSIFRRS